MDEIVQQKASGSHKIKPIIKWTGGKYNEFESFSNYIPAFNNYYEPFFGGGGVFFALQPKANSFVNDKSTDLVNFYSLIGSPGFKKELLEYAHAWDEAGKLAKEIIPLIIAGFKNLLDKKINETDFSELVKCNLDKILPKYKDHLFNERFVLFPDKFENKLVHSIADKCRRIKNIEEKESRQFLLHELPDHLETAVKSALYLYLRSITNLHWAKKITLTKEKASANWYFVREFCYASMFRFNSKGEFNIPYGGIAYNKKNFRIKVENIFSPKVKLLFAKAQFSNLDFEEFLKNNKPAKDDFVFVDPPYDSEFSEYDQNTFTKLDQQRLRNVLFSLTAKWMIVIKETDFIRTLYTSPKCRIIDFDKTYTYNVRGRNNRDTKHLIILNYDVK